MNEENVDGVVITHGTDTLEETSYFLDLALSVNIPVVITGAMRSSNELGADGLINLQSAILVALNEESRDKGVLVVMNDEIHNAKFVTKTHTTNVATFQTPTFGLVA
ncbi:Probable L-asparaginase periplasmic precursor [Mannheimia haemolytica]|uniref:Probable L-asparaginase periplasmic n=1 Tax=Mannheimia haemolytica TaxID=75985 RepID=A0A378N650_MANHA|nr:Probable L-asparaginase periplasmic precursor [Mannheimia haemolytica]